MYLYYIATIVLTLQPVNNAAHQIDQFIQNSLQPKLFHPLSEHIRLPSVLHILLPAGLLQDYNPTQNPKKSKQRLVETTANFLREGAIGTFEELTQLRSIVSAASKATLNYETQNIIDTAQRAMKASNYLSETMKNAAVTTVKAIDGPRHRSDNPKVVRSTRVDPDMLIKNQELFTNKKQDASNLHKLAEFHQDLNEKLSPSQYKQAYAYDSPQTANKDISQSLSRHQLSTSNQTPRSSFLSIPEGRNYIFESELPQSRILSQIPFTQLGIEKALHFQPMNAQKTKLIASRFLRQRRVGRKQTLKHNEIHTPVSPQSYSTPGQQLPPLNYQMARENYSIKNANTNNNMQPGFQSREITIPETNGHGRHITDPINDNILPEEFY